MLKRKRLKDRGKLKLSQYFQEFKDGDKVAIIGDLSFQPAYPKRVQGLTGEIVGSRGDAYIVKITEGNMKKLHILKPVHSKKLK